MSIRFNHTIVWCRDQQRSATFLADVLGLAAPIRFGPFMVVTLDDGASLDFDQVEGEVAFQHYAFLTDEDDFDAIFARVRERVNPKASSEASSRRKRYGYGPGFNVT